MMRKAGSSQDINQSVQKDANSKLPYTAPKLYPNLLEQYTRFKQQYGSYEITIQCLLPSCPGPVHRGPSGS
jgi:hypothetical protein